MAKKEFKVGETFQCGLIKLKCEKVHCETCMGCYFRYEDNCEVFFKFIGSCCASNREDKTNVIFVKVDDIEE